MNAPASVTRRAYTLRPDMVFQPVCLADSIKAIRDPATRKHLAEQLADLLAPSRVRFDRTAFLEQFVEKEQEHTPQGGPGRERGARPATDRPAGLSIGHISPQREKLTCVVEVWKDAFLVQVRRPGIGEPPPDSSRRGTVAGFSTKSRLRLMVAVNKVAMSEGKMPLFLTCTFPDSVPDPKDVPRIWDNFCRMLERCFPKVGMIWKKELKTRLSGLKSVGKTVPHFHALAWGLPESVPWQERRGKWFRVQRVAEGWRWQVFALGEDGNRIAVQDAVIPETMEFPFLLWLSALWYEAVGTGDARHFRAGTNLSQVRSVAGVRFYVSKYMGKECDGQSEWACGRWWGVRKKGNIPWGEREVIELTKPQANTLVRCVRRYIKATRGKKVKLLGSTVNLFTGDSAQWQRLAKWLARGALSGKVASTAHSLDPIQVPTN